MKLTATRVHQRDAKGHYDAGGTVLVSEYGHQLTHPVGRTTTTHSRTSGLPWDELVDMVATFRGRYPNQRFYIVWPEGDTP